jgi:hypothetical protein
VEPIGGIGAAPGQDQGDGGQTGKTQTHGHRDRHSTIGYHL